MFLFTISFQYQYKLFYRILFLKMVLRFKIIPLNKLAVISLNFLSYLYITCQMAIFDPSIFTQSSILSWPIQRVFSIGFTWNCIMNLLFSNRVHPILVFFSQLLLLHLVVEISPLVHQNDLFFHSQIFSRSILGQ